ncbi:MAG: SpoIIE family protein phosphatase [Epsilonproteobacteria bacterium]|nr:SpoIIE family protein phosphatase [Campylobacterota bacterium]
MNCEELEKEYESCQKKLKKLEKRMDRVLKQSDKQQLEVLKLYEQIEELYNYNISQQEIAKTKLMSLLVNELADKTKIIFKASDVLSGDYYSIFEMKNGYFMYLLDGQGHGVSPALTIFALASNILQILKDRDIEFNELIEKLFTEAKKFLLQDEQLSFFMLYIDKNLKDVSYAAGGIYPVYVKDKNSEIHKIKANNLPFTKNSNKLPEVNTVSFEEGISSAIMYSDGLVEEYEVDLLEYRPQLILQDPSKMEALEKTVKNEQLADDLTVIYIDFEKES